jgi:hypothetical protein
MLRSMLLRFPNQLVAFFALTAVVLGLAAACGGSKPAAPAQDAVIETPVQESNEDALVGRPQNRAGIGDVDRAFARYEDTRSDMIALFREQPWFKDGLTRDESLFVERSLTFVGRYDGPRKAYVSEETIRRKLYRYDKVAVGKGEVEVLLIYEPGQDAEREMTFIKAAVPALEGIVGIEFPAKVMTVVNGAFEINDFNESEFIRIARCCVTSSFVLAHELSHTYWSMGPSWFNEGMADIYATLVNDKLSTVTLPGWRVNGNLDAFYQSRKKIVDSGRLPNITLPRRLASDGLYEVADVFLLDIRDLIGEEAFTKSVRSIYLASDFGRYYLREKRIEDIFLEQAKPESRQALMDLFNRAVWGDNGERYKRLQDLEAP